MVITKWKRNFRAYGIGAGLSDWGLCLEWEAVVKERKRGRKTYIASIYCVILILDVNKEVIITSENVTLGHMRTAKAQIDLIRVFAIRLTESLVHW